MFSEKTVEKKASSSVSRGPVLSLDHFTVNVTNNNKDYNNNESFE